MCAVGATSAHKDVSKFPGEGYRSKEVPLFLPNSLCGLLARLCPLRIAVMAVAV